MTRIVKAELAQDLTDLFPVLEPRSLSPDEVSSTLQLVHDFLTGTHKFRAVIERATVGGSQVLVVADVPRTGSDVYRLILAAHGIHNGAANHFLWFETINGKTGGQRIALQTALSMPANVPIGLARSVLIPPDHQIQLATEALPGVGEALTIRVSFVDMLLLDPHPAL